MLEENQKHFFFSAVREHGVSKVALVILCLLCWGGFYAFVLRQFIDMLAQGCYTAFPYLSCNGAELFFDGAGAVIVSFAGPLLTFNWLLKKSFICLVALTVSIFVLTILGTQYLKNRYEQLVQTK
ncbi:MAG: hypothetical protein WC817_03980 [Patescibacteria group bacterium]|jgi:hypothetical protein